MVQVVTRCIFIVMCSGVTSRFGALDKLSEIDMLEASIWRVSHPSPAD